MEELDFTQSRSASYLKYSHLLTVAVSMLAWASILIMLLTQTGLSAFKLFVAKSAGLTNPVSIIFIIMFMTLLNSVTAAVFTFSKYKSPYTRGLLVDHVFWLLLNMVFAAMLVYINS